MSLLYVVALVDGTLFVFFNVAARASLARVVEPEQLPAAVASQETTWGISALVAYGSLPIRQARTGLLLQEVGPTRTILAISVGVLVSAIAVTANRRFDMHPDCSQTKKRLIDRHQNRAVGYGELSSEVAGTVQVEWAGAPIDLVSTTPRSPPCSASPYRSHLQDS